VPLTGQLEKQKRADTPPAFAVTREFGSGSFDLSSLPEATLIAAELVMVRSKSDVH
jgi:hypothetical protein